MKKNFNRPGLTGAMIVISWGIYLVVVTELTAPKVWNGPGIFGPYAGRVGGIILIIGGLVGVLGSLVSRWVPLLGGFLLGLVLILLVLSLAVTFISPFIPLNVGLVVLFFLAAKKSLDIWAKK